MVIGPLEEWQFNDVSNFLIRAVSVHKFVFITESCVICGIACHATLTTREFCGTGIPANLIWLSLNAWSYYRMATTKMLMMQDGH